MSQLLNVQSLFFEELSENKKVWISTRPAENQTATLELFEYESGNSNKNKDVDIAKHSETLYNVTLRSHVYRVLVPSVYVEDVRKQMYQTSHKGTRGRIVCGAVNQDKIALIGTSDGSLAIYFMQTKVLAKQFTAHEGFDVLKVRFFPSNKVFLTVGLDLQIKIWDLSGKEARRFMGHRQRITDVVLLGSSGRNFATSSLDGSLMIWECGSGKMVKKLQRVAKKSGITCLDCLFDRMLYDKQESEKDSDAGATENSRALEFETQGHVLVCGDNNGLVTVWDAYSGLQIETIGTVTSVPVASLCVFEDAGHRYCVTGDDKGTVRVFVDGGLQTEWKPSNNAVSAVKHVRGSKVVVYSSNDVFVLVDVSKTSLQSDLVALNNVEDYEKIVDVSVDNSAITAFGEASLASYNYANVTRD